jgi:catechol 2,3-dioxygenase-like lactoylglutathione lyase family enzyme
MAQMTERILGFRSRCMKPNLMASFYKDAFGCDDNGNSRLILGDCEIELAQACKPYPGDIAGNDPRFQHFAIVVADMDLATASLSRMNGWKPISVNGPERLPIESGGVTAFNFRDPEGHPPEFRFFPPESQPKKWNFKPHLFKGIDHTALAVVDPASSISFYQKLGFVLAARHVNHGLEQQRLDGFEATQNVEVEVLSLALERGPICNFCHIGRRPCA